MNILAFVIIISFIQNELNESMLKVVFEQRNTNDIAVIFLGKKKQKIETTIYVVIFLI